jgi:hypothetical protein
MGRGLSNLQEFILSETNKLNRCYYADVLEKYYGWAPKKPIERYGNIYTEVISGKQEEKPTPEELVGQIRHPGRRYFSPKEVGLKEYRKVMASLCRACARLRERGLVECLQGTNGHWAGVELTNKGRVWANWLSNRDIAKRLAAGGEYKLTIKGKYLRLRKISKPRDLVPGLSVKATKNPKRVFERKS